MANPVLTAALSGQRKILLSWTFDSSADFQVFWKSSSPTGQEYVLLATTSAFSYTTADLDPSKTYFFYVRANVGATYFYSNVVELFVSCGKGVVLSPTPPDPPPAQTGKGHIYLTVKGGDIYKQSDGEGDFVGLGQTLRYWFGICVAPNGDVYASANDPGGGDIYKQTGGVGNFVALGQTLRDWRFMAAAPNGDIWAAINFSYLYKQAGGVGDFIQQSVTPNTWYGMAFNSAGVIYCAGQNSGYAFKFFKNYVEASGSLPASVTHDMCVAPNGDVYGSVGTDIFKQTLGVGDFVSLGQSFTYGALGMAAAPNGDIYAIDATASGILMKRSRGVGNFTAVLETSGANSREYRGVAVANNL